MKTMNVFLILPLLLFGSLFAQGSLQFNQVRKIQWTQTSPANVTNYHSMGPYVVNVPAGKVLKIESMNVSKVRTLLGGGLQAAYGATNGNDPAVIYLEETAVYTNPGATSPNLSHAEVQIHWLPAGDHNFYIGGMGTTSSFGSPSTYSYAAMITAIEFNVVP